MREIYYRQGDYPTEFAQRTGIPVLLFVPDRGLFMAVEKDTGANWQG